MKLIAIFLILFQSHSLLAHDVNIKANTCKCSFTRVNNLWWVYTVSKVNPDGSSYNLKSETRPPSGSAQEVEEACAADIEVLASIRVCN